MEAATENKRGRPADEDYKWANTLQRQENGYPVYMSNRALQNTVNAEHFFGALIYADVTWEVERFFSGKDCGTKHKGIAEQIGRMMREGLITDEEAIEQAEKCVAAYKRGASSKEIEKQLRQKRMSLKKMRNS